MDCELEDTLSRMILSASGWRGVFAKDAESSNREISFAHKIIAAAAARAFSEYLEDKKSAVIVGRDTRPTGEAIADAVIRSLLSSGREVIYLGIAAAPEIMAFARAVGQGLACDYKNAAGFIYISASHNPIGHNGIKFGLLDGGVLQADEGAKLLCLFKALISENGAVERARALLEGALEGVIEEDRTRVYDLSEKHKKAALRAYREFTEEVISGSEDKQKRDTFFIKLKEGLEKRPLGIAFDFNGSSRTLSIDKDFFTSIGAKISALNDKPGQIVHTIIPEGESLSYCRAFLEENHRKDPSFILGLMPDCDGDRGNLVFWDEKNQRAAIMEAQEVFALACVAEISSLVWSGDIRYDSTGKAITKAAIVVNDPTSYRINRIAEAFDISVFRAEVGEANVVGLARKLRAEGYLVRVFGEGTTGGTITHPSAVRDPIDTLCAILKLLTIRDNGLFGIWLRRCGKAGLQDHSSCDSISMADLIASLPEYFTTGTSSEEARLNVKTSDHGLLKERYQKIFLREWEEKKDELAKSYSFCGWEAAAYNGMEEKRSLSSFAEAGRGGLKIEFFCSEKRKKTASLWMRGSGTEPVFRVIADAPEKSLERYLIKWQRRMVLEADTCG